MSFSYLSLCRVWGWPGVPACQCRPRLCSGVLGHTPWSPGGSSSSARILKLMDQGGCKQTSSHMPGTKTHHRDRVMTLPMGTTPYSGNVPSFYCDLSRRLTEEWKFTGTNTVWLFFPCLNWVWAATFLGRFIVWFKHWLSDKIKLTRKKRKKSEHN